MAFVKYLFYILLLYGTISLVLTVKRRPLVLVLCLKGFRWDLPHSYSHLPNFRRLATTGSRALWVESEFGGSQTNILSLMSGLHVEHHARGNFLETIPVVNEHVGGHTRLFHWPWFDLLTNHSVYEHLRSGRKGQPEIIESYLNHGRMSLQRLLRSMNLMLKSLTNDNDRTNLIMTYVDEPFTTLVRHGIHSDGMRRTMLSIDRLIGRLLTVTTKNDINLLIIGDHGVEEIGCRQAIYFYDILEQGQLNMHADRQSGTSFSFVLYPKTDFGRQILLHQLRKLTNTQIQIYSNDQSHLPPELRLPVIAGKPPPILIFAKKNFYFTYNAQQNPAFCQKTNNKCRPITLADHSEDPRRLSMRTALFAHGPYFKKGHINEPVLITDLYPLLRQILCLSPLPTSGKGLSNIHNMLDFSTLSNTCAYLYLSSRKMIRSVSMQPIKYSNYTKKSNQKLVQINITEKHRLPHRKVVRMRVIID